TRACGRATTSSPNTTARPRVARGPRSSPRGRAAATPPRCPSDRAASRAPRCRRPRWRRYRPREPAPRLRWSRASGTANALHDADPWRWASEVHPQPGLHLRMKVAFEVLAPSARRDLSQAEHVDVLGHLHHPAHVVVDEEDGHALGSEGLDVAVDLRGDDGSRSE